MSVIQPEKKTLAGIQIRDEKGNLHTYNRYSRKWTELQKTYKAGITRIIEAIKKEQS